MSAVYRWGQHTAEHANEKEMTPALLNVREWIQQRLSLGNGDAEVVGPDSWWSAAALPKQLREAVMAEVETYNIHPYGFRMTTLKRAPKVAFKIDAPGPLNHVILIRYSGPEHHAPEHHDKQEGVKGAGAKDILASTPIVSITLCADGDERTFSVTADDGAWAWKKKLGDGDLFVLGPETNKVAKHGVPKEGRKGQVRYSLIFRSVKLLDVNQLAKKSKTAGIKKSSKKRSTRSRSLKTLSKRGKGRVALSWGSATTNVAARG